MAQLKFYRKNIAPTSPAQGAIWFNTKEKTIQIYTGTAWEKYAGNLNDATWSGSTLTITKHDGSSIALNFSDMASAATMGKIIAAAGLNSDGTHKANAVNYGGTSIGEEIKNIDAATKAVSNLVGTTSVASQISTEIEKLDVTDTAVTNQYVSSVSETDGKISVSRVALPVTGVKSADKVLQLTNGEVSSTITISYNKTDKKIYLYGIDQTTPISEIDATDFIADSFLDKVELDASDNLQFTWKMADGSTKTDTVNISKYIDTYTAGNGLSLTGKSFSVDTTKIATKTSVDNLNTTVSENHTELVSLAGATVNTKAIGTVDADGKVSGNSITLAGSDIAITGYTKGTASDLTATDTINTALGKLEARVDAAAAGGVQAVNGYTGNVVIVTGTKNGTIAVRGGNMEPFDIDVAGLKSAAFTASSDYATAAQGATADSAVQTVTTDNTNQLDVTRTGNDVKVNVELATKSEMMGGQYRNEATGNGNESPLITASTVDYFVTNYVTSAIDNALVWEEFE